MNYYINKNIQGNYINFDFTLDSNSYSIGKTYDDFLLGKWILLTKKQINFHTKYNDANIREVINCKLDKVIETKTINEYKEKILMDIDYYDKSREVRKIIINNIEREWLTKDERVYIERRLKRDLEDGIRQTPINFGIETIYINPQIGIDMLKKIDRYADLCYDVTFKHKVEVIKTEDIELLKSYNIKNDYPTPLNISL